MKVLLSPLNVISGSSKQEIANTNSHNISFGGYSFIAKKLPHLHCAYCSKELVGAEKVSSLAQFLSVCRAEPKCTNALLEKLKFLTDNLSPSTKKIMNFLLQSIKNDAKHSPKAVFNRITTGSMPDATTSYFKAIFSLYNKKYLEKISIESVFMAFSNSFKAVHDDAGQQLGEVIDFNKFFAIYTKFLQKPKSKSFLNSEFLKLQKNENAIFSPKRFIGNLDDKVRLLQKEFISNGGQKPVLEWNDVTRGIHDEMVALADMEHDIKPIFLSLSRDKKIFWGMHAGYSPEKTLTDVFMEIMPTTDHINPRSKGGIDVAGNYLLACKSCNYDRSNTDFVNFVNSTDSKENIMRHITELDNRLPFLKDKEANLLFKYIEAIKKTLNDILNVSPATPNFDTILKAKQSLVK